MQRAVKRKCKQGLSGFHQLSERCLSLSETFKAERGRARMSWPIHSFSILVSFLKQTKKKKSWTHNDIMSTHNVNLWPPGETLGVTWLCLKRGGKTELLTNTGKSTWRGKNVHTSCVSACAPAHTQTHKKKEKVHYNEPLTGGPCVGTLTAVVH